ncbi:LOB domain-containing protein 1 [Beta vulgaris subsp. vulgaris]|uniref:LOB domain-containing protein 1 n=1 Tax=Beta vulgaris subsp. vulgaris TaxID=3555 RepID=UPI002037462D|nr:LOB domain-containing protein 1 [Beta vulgaris subsp. vulgaris]
MESNYSSDKMMYSSPGATSTPSPGSPQSPNSPPSGHGHGYGHGHGHGVGGAPVIMSPCAACKILRRRCADKCVLAPYFPPTDPLKFTIAHKVFGASNIIKLLQDLPESQRADAVSSMVYEANARLRDPVYGCAGAICQLQKQVSDLQAELAKSRAEIVNMQCQQANLLALICMEMTTQSQDHAMIPVSASSPQSGGSSDSGAYEIGANNSNNNNFLSFYDDNNSLNSIWEPLWT